jgi:RHS repeat-associated protein
MRKLFFSTILPILFIAGLTVYGISIGNMYYSGLGNNMVYADSMEDNPPTVTGPDVSGMFNERGYYKSNSVSVDENELISDFNGNLMYTFPMFNIKGKGDLYANFSLNYNGSMSYKVIAGDSLDVGSTQQSLPEYNINAPGWVFNLNGMGVQMLNFETNFFTNAPSANDTLVTDDDVRLLATGYHLTDRLSTSDGNENFRDKLMILQGDGSVLTLKRFTGPSEGGDEKFYIGEYYTENRGEFTRAIVKFAEDGQSGSYRNREVHVMRGDGLTYIFREHKASFSDFPLTLNSNPQLRPQMLLLSEVADRFGNKMNLTYQYIVDDVIGSPHQIQGRPWLSNISVPGGGGISLNYGHSTSLGVVNVWGPMGKYRVEMDGFDIFHYSPHRPFVEKIENPTGDEIVFTPDVYNRRAFQLTYVQPGNSLMSLDLELDRIKSVKNYNGGVRDYSYMGGVDEFATMSPAEGYKIMVWGGSSIKNTKYFGQGRDVFFNNMIKGKITKDENNDVIKLDTFMYNYSTSRTYADWAGNPVSADDDYFTTIETTPGSAGNQFESPGKFGSQKKYKNYGVGITQIGESSDIEGHTKMLRELFYNSDTSNFYKKIDYYFIPGETSSFPDTLVTETLDGIERSTKAQYEYASGPIYIGEGLRPIVKSTTFDPLMRKTETFYKSFLDTSIHYENGIFWTNQTLNYDTTYLYLLNQPDSVNVFSPEGNPIHKEKSEYILENGILNPGYSDSGYIGQIKNQKVFAGPSFTDFKETKYKYFMNDTLGMTLWTIINAKPSNEGKLKSVIDPKGNYTNYYYHLVRGVPGLNSIDNPNYDEYAGPGIRYKIAKENGQIDTINAFSLRDDRFLPSITQAIPNSQVSLYDFKRYDFNGKAVIGFNNNRYISNYSYDALERIENVILPYDFGSGGIVDTTVYDTIFTQVEFTTGSNRWGIKDYYDSDYDIWDSNADSYFLIKSVPGEDGPPVKKLPVTNFTQAFIDTLNSMDSIESVYLEFHPPYLSRPNNYNFFFAPIRNISYTYSPKLLDFDKGSNFEIPINTFWGDTSLLDPGNILNTYNQGLLYNLADVTNSVKAFLETGSMEGFVFDAGSSDLSYDFLLPFNKNILDVGSPWYQYYSPRLHVRGIHRKIDSLTYPIFSGSTLEYEYDDPNNKINILSKLSSGRSKKTLHEFDGFYRVKKSKLFNNTSANTYDSTQIFYNYMDAQAKTIDGRNNQTKFSYDKWMNAKKVENPDTSFTLDTSIYQNGLNYHWGSVSGLVGKQVFTDEEGNKFEKFSDAVGNLRREVKFVDMGTPSSPLIDSLITDYRYDSLYRVTNVKTPNNKIISYKYDGFGRQVERTTIDAGTEKFKHDKNDNLRFSKDAVQNSNSQVTFRRYDGINRLLAIGIAEEDSREWDFATVDPDQIHDFENYSVSPSNFLTLNVYDTLSTSIASGLFTPPSDYYSADNLTMGNLMATAYKTRTSEAWNYKYYRYDARGRVKRMWHVQDGLGTKVIDYNYNSSNSAAYMTYQNGVSGEFKKFRYDYDDAGRLSDVKVFHPDDPEDTTDAMGTYKSFAGYTYNQNSMMDTLKMNEGNYWTRNVYNNRNWLYQITDVPENIFNEVLLYNKNGNINKQILAGTYDDSMDDGGNLTIDYSYDKSNRLLNADVTFGSKDMYDVENTYDKDGNLLTLKRDDASGSLADDFNYSYYSGTNKLAKVTGSQNQYEYDANGNVTSDMIDSFSSLWDIKYDHRNLMTEFRHTIGQFPGSTKMWYDEAGNRIRKVTLINTGSGGGEIPDWDSLEYFPPYDPEGGDGGDGDSWNIMVDERYISGVAGNEIAIYDGTILRQWQIGNDGNIKANGDKFFNIKDHLGTTKAVIDTSNTVVQAQDLDIWGYVIPTRQYSTFEKTDYLFTGKERDVESSGYDYFGARYYNSRIGRWGGVEPLMEKYISWTPYQYGICNPILQIDINGMEIDGSELEKEENEDFKENLYEDIKEITGLELYTDEEGKIRYKKDSKGNAKFKKKGTSAKARDKLMEVIDSKVGVWTFDIGDKVGSQTPVGGLYSYFNPDDIQELVNGTEGVYSKTLGFGMTFLHEMYHTSLGGSLPDGEGEYVTGPTVDEMNIIRKELGSNWGQRLSYEFIVLRNSNSIYLPMGHSAVASLKWGESPRTGYIRR